MERYLIDTNVVSDYLSASLPISGMDFLDGVIGKSGELDHLSPVQLDHLSPV
ncbi:MAG: hypothetical protein K1X82_05195 [Bacteroidia bacterium]|nr:hypothetical protein [Bacteroidia bacterium]